MQRVIKFIDEHGIEILVKSLPTSIKQRDTIVKIEDKETQQKLLLFKAAIVSYGSFDKTENCKWIFQMCLSFAPNHQ